MGGRRRHAAPSRGRDRPTGIWTRCAGRVWVGATEGSGAAAVDAADASPGEGGRHCVARGRGGTWRFWMKTAAATTAAGIGGRSGLLGCRRSRPAAAYCAAAVVAPPPLSPVGCVPPPTRPRLFGFAPPPRDAPCVFPPDAFSAALPPSPARLLVSAPPAGSGGVAPPPAGGGVALSPAGAGDDTAPPGRAARLQVDSTHPRA